LVVVDTEGKFVADADGSVASPGDEEPDALVSWVEAGALPVPLASSTTPMIARITTASATTNPISLSRLSIDLVWGSGGTTGGGPDSTGGAALSGS
jgi:hypothetical protein